MGVWSHTDWRLGEILLGEEGGKLGIYLGGNCAFVLDSPEGKTQRGKLKIGSVFAFGSGKAFLSC